MLSPERVDPRDPTARLERRIRAWGLITLGVAFSLAMRTPLKVDVVRDRAALARIVAGGQIENVYRLQVMNASEASVRYKLSVTGIEGLYIVSDELVQVDAASSRWVPVRVQMLPGAAGPGSHPIRFHIEAQGEVAREIVEKSVFLVPR